MKKPSERDRRDQLRDKIIGLGEKSIRKSYYPELQQRIAELEKTNRELREEIAERKKAEEVNVQLEQQLQQAMKMEAIGTLAGGIAHDFNNILTAIIGYTDLAKLTIEKSCPEDALSINQNLDQMLEAGHRARQLVQQILTFSRQQKRENIPVQLGEVVQEALRLLRSTIPTTIEIREELLAGDGYTMADPIQMHQITMNLCTNGYQAMREEGGVLTVRLSRSELDKSDMRVDHLQLEPGPYLVLAISDTGVGMSRAVQERIFDPYFTTKGESGGTGMGLAVVHGIVKEHKGYVSVYSEVGMGTTFRVHLPEVQVDTKAQVACQLQEVPGGSERILLVDDEKFVLDLERAILEKLGYRVTACLSGVQALEVFEEQMDAFDLIITDMTMPKVNGAQLINEIIERKPTMPIIICTGFSELIDEKKAKSIGASEYVMKPFVLREIAFTLRKVLDREN